MLIGQYCVPVTAKTHNICMYAHLSHCVHYTHLLIDVVTYVQVQSCMLPFKSEYNIKYSKTKTFKSQVIVSLSYMKTLRKNSNPISTECHNWPIRIKLSGE